MNTMVVSAQTPQSISFNQIILSVAGKRLELIRLVKKKGAANPQVRYQSIPEAVCAVSIALCGQLFMHRIQLSQVSFQ